MGKGLMIAASLLVLSFVIAIPTMMVPDHTEASFLSWVARTAEQSKRVAIENSPEVRALEIENDRLHQEIRMNLGNCPVEEPAWYAGFWPFGGEDAPD